jgi:hypothetical protein
MAASQKTLPRLLAKALGTPLTPFYLTLLFLWFPRWLPVILLQSLRRTRLSVLGIDAHLGDGIEEARQIMAHLRSSPLATPTFNRLMATLEQAAH